MKRPLLGLVVVFVAATAAFAAFCGCAVTIVDSGTTSGLVSSSSSGATSGGPDAACAAPDQGTCTCTKGDLRIACSPKNGKLECVCSYGKVFSGICFETDPAELCDFDKGCCANYFSGQ